MDLASKRSLLDSLAPSDLDESEDLCLQDGSRIAVIGGGPAGSFFAFFLLKMAEAVDLDIEVDIYEPRAFSRCGPGGCNHCGGIVSESLVQILAAEGINLPPEVVQRGIESYVVHMDAGRVRLESPAGEQRIAALYRGNGPREGGDSPWESFDLFLQRLAVDRGARMVRKLVAGVEWRGGMPFLLDADGEEAGYDLVAVAAGVNSNFLGLLDGAGAGSPPKTTRAYICEFKSSQEEIARVLGNAMHVFLLDLPRLEFGAFIPKGDFVTMCMLGDDLDQDLVQAFLDAPEVKRCFPVDATPCVCSCSPLMNLKATGAPYADRLVLIGDCGVTRLYKDGIGAAFRTGKAAAAAAVFEGISAEAFRGHYAPVCDDITKDNAIGKLMFAGTTVFKHSKIARRAILRMTRKEQGKPEHARHMSGLLWNMFTGSAPYREIFKGALHPAFITGLVWNFALGVWPGRSNGKEAKS